MDTSLSYEDAFEQLEAAIEALQDGKMPLDEALRHYQEGIRLVQYCNNLLQQAELSIQQLTSDENENISVSPLDV